MRTSIYAVVAAVTLATGAAAYAQQSPQSMPGSQMHGPMSGQGMMMSGQAGSAMSLPERLDWAEKHMTARLEMLQAMKGATTQLYGVLSDEQKGLADQLIHGPMGMM